MAILILVFAFLFGASVGSFLNVCIYRLPREGLSVSKPRRSFCPSCGTAIRSLDNIPLVSWIALGGQCRACKAPISSRYFLVELFTASCFAFLAERLLLSQGEAAVPVFTVLVTLVSALIVASFVDLELRLIPDSITLPGMMVAPFSVLWAHEIHARSRDGLLGRVLLRFQGALLPRAAEWPTWIRDGLGFWAATLLGTVLGFVIGMYGYAAYWKLAHRTSPRPLKDGLLGGILCAATLGILVACVLRPGLLLDPRVESFAAAIAGMAVGAASIFFVGVVGSKVFRKPAMGFGDVKLMGLLGAFAGWDGVLVGGLLACILGSVVGIVVLLRSKSRYIPFGPFLALGAMSWILWPETFLGLLNWYMSLFR